jgi:hypothetical protein
MCSFPHLSLKHPPWFAWQILDPTPVSIVGASQKRSGNAELKTYSYFKPCCTWFGHVVFWRKPGWVRPWHVSWLNLIR